MITRIVDRNPRSGLVVLEIYEQRERNGKLEWGWHMWGFVHRRTLALITAALKQETDTNETHK